MADLLVNWADTGLKIVLIVLLSISLWFDWRGPNARA